ncbi:MFS transporter [Micromonospora sp. M12]
MTATATATAPRPALHRDRRFRTFWAGETVSQFGDRISELALPLIAVTLLAATPVQVSVLTALIWLPNLLGLFLGAWVDQRTHKRRLLVIADLVRAAVLLSLPVAYLFDAITLHQLYLVALLTGLAAVLFAMARQAFFVALVPRSAYVDATSKLSMSRSLSFIAGPAVGGGLVQALSAPVAIIVDAVSFLGSAVLLGRIPVTEPPPPPRQTSTLGLVRKGSCWCCGIRCCGPRSAAPAPSTSLPSSPVRCWCCTPAETSACRPARSVSPSDSGHSAGSPARPSRHGSRGPSVWGAPRSSAWCSFRAAGVDRAGLRAHLGEGGHAGGHRAGLQRRGDADGRQPERPPHRRDTRRRARTPGRRVQRRQLRHPPARRAGRWALGTTIGLRPTLVVAGLGGVLAVVWLLASPVRHIRTLDDPQT